MPSRTAASTPFAMPTKPPTPGAAWSMTVLRARDRCRNSFRSGNSYGSGGEKRLGELVRCWGRTRLSEPSTLLLAAKRACYFAILHHRNLYVAVHSSRNELHPGARSCRFRFLV